MLLGHIYEIERKIFIKNVKVIIDENSAHWKFVKMAWKKKRNVNEHKFYGIKVRQDRNDNSGTNRRQR